MRGWGLAGEGKQGVAIGEQGFVVVALDPEQFADDFGGVHQVDLLGFQDVGAFLAHGGGVLEYYQVVTSRTGGVVGAAVFGTHGQGVVVQVHKFDEVSHEDPQDESRQS